MHDIRLRTLARRLMADGCTVREAAQQVGVPARTVQKWRRELTTDVEPAAICPICAGRRIHDASASGCLLGQYLRDGHLVTSTRVPVLRIYVCTDYPEVTGEVVAAIRDARGRAPADHGAAHTDRMRRVQSYWIHWPCLLPQHGPGRRHLRPILLAPWQRDLVDADPWPLIRGLIHSDGCRAINRVVTRGPAYRYPRYFFSTESPDIMAIMSGALDRAGVRWRFARPNCLSVGRRESATLMDLRVGPKR